MKDRIGDLLRVGRPERSDVWVSTFHSFCARLLRREARHLGLPRDFAIYDDDDQTAAVKRALAQLGLPADDFSPRSVRSQISHAKNHGITPEEMRADAEQARDDDAPARSPKFFAYTTKSSAQAAALDFDDLLLRAVEVLREHPEVRARWSGRFQYMMVDEFQDTNRLAGRTRAPAGRHAQERLRRGRRRSIHLRLARRAGRKFEALHRGFSRREDHPPGRKLPLDADDSRCRRGCGPKQFQSPGQNAAATIGSGGSRVRFFEAQDSTAEAEFVCGEIGPLVRNDADARVAVLYRTGAQSRSFEEVLRRLGIRHRVVGGFSFYERAEVRNCARVRPAALSSRG